MWVGMWVPVCGLGVGGWGTLWFMSDFDGADEGGITVSREGGCVVLDVFIEEEVSEDVLVRRQIGIDMTPGDARRLAGMLLEASD